jgi:signal peptidase I
MALHNTVRHFLFPSLTPRNIMRLVLVALVAYLFFGHTCIPFRIKGPSMEPTYSNAGINFCWRLGYLFSEPAPQDIVLVRLAGKKVMLLKRIIALQGQTVEFRKVRLFVDGKRIDEPYVRYPCNWNLSPRQVKNNSVYLVGDNRSMPLTNHSLGQTLRKRIVGVPLW